LPIVFLVFNVEFPTTLMSFALQLQYYAMLSPILMYFPATLNSLFSILLIGHYRRTAFEHFCCKFNTWKKANAIAPITPAVNNVNVTFQQIIFRHNQIKSSVLGTHHGAREAVPPVVGIGILQARTMSQIVQ
jgi:hypothetical protein